MLTSPQKIYLKLKKNLQFEKRNNKTEVKTTFRCYRINNM